MARTEMIPTSIGLEDARRRIARWRETRTHRGAPMPAALWAAAVAFAQQDGLYRTARRLRVDYGTLKKRMDAAGGAARGFVRIRFFGFLAIRRRAHDLPLCRRALAAVRVRRSDTPCRDGHVIRVMAVSPLWRDVVVIEQLTTHQIHTRAVAEGIFIDTS